MREFTKAHAEWLVEYCDEVVSSFGADFAPHSEVFPGASILFERMQRSRDAVLKDGWKRWPSIDEAHNELCIAAAILSAPDYQIARLDYEPPPDAGAQTIDFRATGTDGLQWLIDVKTIGPEIIDRWDQFETARTKGWFPEQLELVLLRSGLGGELWHLKSAARSRMLEYTLEFEKKLPGYARTDSRTTIMMFCSNGFDWHEDELEDFVAFYVDGHHRFDDPLSKMEQHAIESRRLELPRRVKRFGYCQRGSQRIEATRVNWHVRPPRLPASLGHGPAV